MTILLLCHLEPTELPHSFECLHSTVCMLVTIFEQLIPRSGIAGLKCFEGSADPLQHPPPSFSLLLQALPAC